MFADSVGSGVTYSAVGIRPALSPVATEILRTASVPVYGSHMAGEMVTPIGAAIITTIASAFGAVPAMKIEAVGYGAGKYDLTEAPNLVRLFIGDTLHQVASNQSMSLRTIAGSPVTGGPPTGNSSQAHQPTTGSTPAAPVIAQPTGATGSEVRSPTIPWRQAFRRQSRRMGNPHSARSPAKRPATTCFISEFLILNSKLTQNSKLRIQVSIPRLRR